MCYIDLEPCTVWKEVERTAIKQHQCTCCRRTIFPGERYHTHFSIYEGSIDREKICLHCFADRAEFCAAHRCLCTPSYLVHLLQECIAEGDDESDKVWEPLLNRIKQRGHQSASPKEIG